MHLRLGCVADDYTGASDLANTLTKAGLRTVQTIGIPADDLALPDVDAVVVALKSPSVPAAEAVTASRAAEDWLRRRGAPHVMLKICSTFDSTDAGNIGPVLDAMRRAAGQAIALVTPAFPETGRSVFQGHLFVQGQPLHESPLKDHPLNPMRDSNLMRVLARQSDAPVGLVDAMTIARGAAAVRSRLDALAADGNGAAIADAIFATDLETLGSAVLSDPVSCGASGLGYGLARRPGPGPDPCLGRTGCAGSGIRHADTRGRFIGLSRRQLLAGHLAADWGRRGGHAGPAPGPGAPDGSRRRGRRDRLGPRPRRRRSRVDRQQRCPRRRCACCSRPTARGRRGG